MTQELITTIADNYGLPVACVVVLAFVVYYLFKRFEEVNGELVSQNKEQNEYYKQIIDNWFNAVTEQLKSIDDKIDNINNKGD